MECFAKHTKWQPSKSDWRCPKCGVDAAGRDKTGQDTRTMGFVIEQSAVGADEECAQLHENDEIHCDHCGYTATGAGYAKSRMKTAKLVRCAHCKGTGLVPKTKHGT